MSYMDTKFCEVCDEKYDWAAPECPGCVRRRYDEAQEKKIAGMKAQLEVAQAFHDVAVRERDLARIEADRLRATMAAARETLSYQPHEPPSRTAYVVGLERALSQIAAVMNCDPNDSADLVEAARLLVRERDAARAEVERLRGLLRQACVAGDLISETPGAFDNFRR